MSTPRETPSPYCLALTGGIACGKSTVGSLLQSNGLDRVDSDQVSRAVVEPETPGLAHVVQHFGQTVLQPSGVLDRSALAAIVFSNPQARQELEAILHPLIWKSLEQSMLAADREQRETVFEIPLLYEKGSQSRFSTVWVVTASPQMQLQRLQARDGLTLSQAEARLAAQMSVQQKARQADLVLTNDGDLPRLQSQVEKGLALWRQKRDMAKK